MEYDYPGLLRFDLTQHGNFVEFQIFEQAESITASYSGIKSNHDWEMSNGFFIYSYYVPEIGEHDLYLRGKDKAADERTVRTNFHSSEKAELFIEQALAAFDEFAAQRGISRVGQRPAHAQLELW